MKAGYGILDILEMAECFTKLTLSCGKDICCFPLCISFSEDENGWDTEKWLLVDLCPENVRWPLGKYLYLEEKDVVAFQCISKEDTQQWLAENNVDDIIDVENGHILKEEWKSKNRVDVLDNLQKEEGYVRLFLPDRARVCGKVRSKCVDGNDKQNAKKILFEPYPFESQCFFSEEDVILYQKISEEELFQFVEKAAEHHSATGT